MNGEALLLILGVAAVGVLHTIVPDHWVPIALIARQRGWTRDETARVAFRAGIGHVLSTLVIGLAVWLAGVAFAVRFGSFVDTAASVALIGFGGWIAVSAWREMRGGAGHGHTHDHHHDHGHGHGHGHDHTAAPHEHQPRTSSRTALMLILGSSPMVEGIPAFFAAAKFGIGVIIVMAVVFAISTITTYVVLCIASTVGLQRVSLGSFERYGEVLSGAFIALVGATFYLWPLV